MLRWFFGLPIQLKIAIIMAPFLAIGGYGLVDTWKRPEMIQQNVSQTVFINLKAPASCPLNTDRCVLAHEAFRIQLAAVTPSQAELVRLSITPNQAIRGLQMAVVQEGEEQQLIAQRLTNQDFGWYVEFPHRILTSTSFEIRLALAQTRKIWVAEFSASL